MKLEFLIFLLLHIKPNFATEELNQKIDTDENNNLDIFSKCYDGIGCIDTDTRWYDKKKRPINLKPTERHIIKTDFLLLRPSSEQSDNLVYNSFVAKEDSLKASGFRMNLDVLILIHDFTGNGYTGWIKHVGYYVFIRKMDMNVISVDWQRGAEPPYDQAIANGRVVALEIIHLIRELKDKFKYSLENIHLVGHGVGAHIAGYVGSAVEGIKKITGLDPSGPRFEGMPDIVKLNPSNAKYVEIIHTDAFEARSLGTREPMGHSDFYVNNANLQLGCPTNKTFPKVIDIDKSSLNQGEILPGCSHKRSFKYFIESIVNTNCSLLGILCKSFEQYSVGQCTSCGNKDGDCRIFGLNKNYRNSQIKNTYYFNVAERIPYCLFQYEVEIIVTNLGNNVYGYFDLMLFDGEGSVSEANLATEPRFRTITGGNNIFIYYAQPPKLSKITELKLQWNEKKKFYCFIYCRQIINVEKIKLSLLDENIKENRRAYTLCPLNGEKSIENGSFQKFTLCSGTPVIRPTESNKSTTKKVAETHTPASTSKANYGATLAVTSTRKS